MPKRYCIPFKLAVRQMQKWMHDVCMAISEPPTGDIVWVSLSNVSDSDDAIDYAHELGRMIWTSTDERGLLFNTLTCTSAQMYKELGRAPRDLQVIVILQLLDLHYNASTFLKLRSQHADKHIVVCSKGRLSALLRPHVNLIDTADRSLVGGFNTLPAGKFLWLARPEAIAPEGYKGFDATAGVDAAPVPASNGDAANVEPAAESVHVTGPQTSALPASMPVGIDQESLTRFMQRMRGARAKASSGLAADVAAVLAAAPTLYAGTINVAQTEGLLHGFLTRPKQSLMKTLRSVPWEAAERRQHGFYGPTARDRELLCPVLTKLAETLDEMCVGRNWERSVICTETARRGMLQQMILELRLSHPTEYIPTAA